MSKPKAHPPSSEPPAERIDLMQIVSLVLSIYVLGALAVETLYRLRPEVSLLLQRVDSIICLFFLYDFFLRFHKAESKLQFLKWGWLDFISSIPMFPIFNAARVARVVHLVRILRAFRSTKILIHFVYKNRARGTLMTAGLIAMLLAIFSSIAMLTVETAPNSNIKTPDDALWWAVTTITTVGYGDRYPVTDEGRVVAVFLMIAGVGLFATFTGYVTSFFREADHKKEEQEIHTLLREVRLLRQKIEDLEVLTRNRSVSDQAERHGLTSDEAGKKTSHTRH